MIFVLNSLVPDIAPYWEIGSPTDPLVLAFNAKQLPILLATKDKKGLARELPYGWMDGSFIGLIRYGSGQAWADCTFIMREMKRIDLERGLSACPVWHRFRYRRLAVPEQPARAPIAPEPPKEEP